ncbi:Dyp-type peroxidase [Chromobacterium vaccinii]|uniref:Dyp-type peroxidase n=1 Tax=Chromobacterium vaccinii TaxID=1108595 RepID=UPI000E115EB8|nr:Dyp-type peroxidase [Chromobacterium vaccinii]SUX30570.1 Dyp-type peroxidase family [Chromobacterium vaccinii]
MNTTHQAPTEPVLAMDDIQGIAVPGFLKPSQTLLGLRLPMEHDQLLKAKRFLGELAAEVSSARQTLEDRRAYRRNRQEQNTRHLQHQGDVMMAIGFSAHGLSLLAPGGVDLASPAFQQNMAARSALLGDPADPSNEGHSSNWVIGGPGNEPDMLLVLAGDGREALDQKAAELMDRLYSAHILVIYQENGDVRTDSWDQRDMRGHEHFGFDDGISQPGIRGRASEAKDDFITERHIAPAATPDAWLYGLPGQDLLWPGEFVLGYPASSPDPLIPGPVKRSQPDWSVNGSFLVFRRLRQDVSLFWGTMHSQASALATKPGFGGMSDEMLASMIVGRWMSGAPVNRAPSADNPQLGKDKWANNNFRYGSDTPSVPILGHDDTYPKAKADPVGLICPWAAHIRKVNVRDAGSDMGGNDATYTRRLLRVGVPFGKPLPTRETGARQDPEQGNRGLLFLSIQASLEDQFEFLQARWMNDAVRPKMPGGHDVLIGQNPTAEGNRVRSCVLFGQQLQTETISIAAQWVIPTGGGYFFLPSIPALREVIGGC